MCFNQQKIYSKTNNLKNNLKKNTHLSTELYNLLFFMYSITEFDNKYFTLSPLLKDRRTLDELTSLVIHSVTIVILLC